MKVEDSREEREKKYDGRTRRNGWSGMQLDAGRQAGRDKLISRHPWGRRGYPTLRYCKIFTMYTHRRD